MPLPADYAYTQVERRWMTDASFSTPADSAHGGDWEVIAGFVGVISADGSHVSYVQESSWAKPNVTEYLQFRARIFNRAGLAGPYGATVNVTNGPHSGIDLAQAKAKSLGNAAIADGAVSTTQLANAAVTAAKLIDGAVLTAKIADNAVSLQKIVDAAVGTNKIADAAITNIKIGNAAIENAHIQRLGANKLQVVDADIVNLSAAKITAGTLAADVIYGGTIAANKIGAGTIAAAISMTSPSLQITGTQFQCTINPTSKFLLTGNGLTTKLTQEYDTALGVYNGFTCTDDDGITAIGPSTISAKKVANAGLATIGCTATGGGYLRITNPTGTLKAFVTGADGVFLGSGFDTLAGSSGGYKVNGTTVIDSNAVINNAKLCPRFISQASRPTLNDGEIVTWWDGSAAWVLWRAGGNYFKVQCSLA